MSSDRTEAEGLVGSARYREYILERSQPIPECGCWIWDRGVNGRHMYGVASANGRKIGAHRLSYMAFVGGIPSGLYVCHKCDVRTCVNPDHLFLGSQYDNLRDASKKGRIVFGIYPGETNARSRLKAPDVLDIRARYAKGEMQKDLAREYGVGASTVQNIVNRNSWRHLA